MKAKHFYIAGVILVALGVTVGLWLAGIHPKVSPAYLAKYIEYPSFYPLEEADTVPGYGWLWASLVVHSFFGTVCWGFGAVVGKLDKIIETKKSEAHVEQKPAEQQQVVAK